MNFHPQSFTFAGRLILLIALVIVIGGTAATVYCGNEYLPSGRYPIVAFAFPPLIAAGLFISFSMVLLKLARLEFYSSLAQEEESFSAEDETL